MGNDASHSVALGDSITNDIKVTWRKVTDCSFQLREGQCACSHGNHVYVFGGVIQGQGDDLLESNDLLCYDVGNDTWSLVDAKGSLPPARSAASLVCVGDKLYLYGGLSHELGWSDTLHVYDLGSGTWSQLEGEGPRPSPRDKLQAAVVGPSIYYFGGFGPQQTGDDEEGWEDMDDDDVLEEEHSQQAAQFGWFNDLHIFDTASGKWSQPMQMNLGVPTARAAHGMCAVGRDLYIFGGRDAKKRCNDLHVFNVDSRKWNTELECGGKFPGPRSFHSVTAVGNRVMVMGGRAQDNSHHADLNIFDTVSHEWYQPAVGGELPSARGQHSVACVGDKLVLYGGSSGFSSEIMACHKFHGDTFTAATADVLKGWPIQKPVSNGHSTEPGTS